MAIKRFSGDAQAGDIRAMSPPPPIDAVAEILDAVKSRGDAAVDEFEARFGEAATRRRVDADVIDRAPEEIDDDLLAALSMAIRNVRVVARAARHEPTEIDLPEGQSVRYRTVPVKSAAVYVPGGRGSYPSTAIMGLATAREACVERLAVLSPAREHGAVDTAVLAVCALLEVDEVHAIGGAQAVAAAALGTATIEPVDVIVGPGNSYVQEAKRQLVGQIGIDSVAGPSELVVVADESGDAELITLDLLAQGEHGPDSLVVLVSTSTELIDEVEARCAEIGAELALVQVDDLDAGVALAEQIAPEHLELMVVPEREDELLAQISSAGAVFVGNNAGTAFGDYVVGSNHVLPTGGAARYASALSVDTFQRRFAEIRIPDEAAGGLAWAGAKIARGEGFIKHAESMEARTK
jgi:histidinol dehydrogenase